MTVAAEITVSQVVGKHYDYVRLLPLGIREEKNERRD